MALLGTRKVTLSPSPGVGAPAGYLALVYTNASNRYSQIKYTAANGAARALYRKVA